MCLKLIRRRARIFTANVERQRLLSAVSKSLSQLRNMVPPSVVSEGLRTISCLLVEFNAKTVDLAELMSGQMQDGKHDADCAALREPRQANRNADSLSIRKATGQEPRTNSK